MKRIGIHDGRFHADEVVGCYLLMQLPEYRDAVIVRSRDPEVLAKCDVLVDVGGVFDPKTHRYDHHQRLECSDGSSCAPLAPVDGSTHITEGTRNCSEFNHTMRTLTGLPFDTRLSSAGLIYAHFGKRVLKELLDFDDLDAEGNSPKLELMFEKLYGSFIEEMDGMDNGIEPYTGKPRYKLHTILSNRVNALFPAWNNPNKDSVNLVNSFHKAMHLAGKEFRETANFYYNTWIPAGPIVEEAIKNRMETHECGQIIVIEYAGLPWTSHLLHLEHKFELSTDTNKILFICFLGEELDHWRIQAVPVNESERFSNRLRFPDSWRGLRDPEIAQACGVPDARFCHASGHLAGAANKQAAVQMAVKAIQASKNKEMIGSFAV